jgi:hypothetical protein
LNELLRRRGITGGTSFNL